MEAPDARAAWRTGRGAMSGAAGCGRRHMQGEGFSCQQLTTEGRRSAGGSTKAIAMKARGRGSLTLSAELNTTFAMRATLVETVMHEGGRIRRGRYAGSKGPGAGASETRDCCAKQRVCDEQCT